MKDVLNFWFGENGENPNRANWFKPTEAFDAEIRQRFSGHLEMAKSGDLDDWKKSKEGCVALILVLDQFPRNLFRGSALAFSWDAQALETTYELLATGLHFELEAEQRAFAYMPLMHSENLAEQVGGEALFLRLAEETEVKSFYPFAVRHREIIERFGRFPHRNAVLRRVSTPEEVAFLQQPGSSF